MDNKYTPRYEDFSGSSLQKREEKEEYMRKYGVWARVCPKSPRDAVDLESVAKELQANIPHFLSDDSGDVVDMKKLFSI